MKTLFILVCFLAACGPGQKGTRLQELERMLQDPDASLVKAAPGGKQIYQEARQYRRLSLESWDSGEVSRSEEYAMLGWLKYRTAVAIYEQFQARDRLEIANAKVVESNPEIKSVNDEEIKLSSEITRLEDRVAFLKRQKAAQGDRGRMVVNTKEVKSGGGESVSAFNRELMKVEAARVSADKVNAKTHAPEMYGKANNLLKSLKAEIARNNSVSNDMMRRTKFAIVYFESAEKDAAAGFSEEESKKDPVKRQRVLINELTKIYGSDRVIVEANSIRVVMSSSFVSGGTSINSLLEKQLDILSPIVERFDDFSINVEGFTEKGDATDNLGVSQIRAKRVRDYLKSKAPSNSNLNYSGRGQENLRFPTSVENNRVEIVFNR